MRRVFLLISFCGFTALGLTAQLWTVEDQPRPEVCRVVTTPIPHGTVNVVRCD